MHRHRTSTTPAKTPIPNPAKPMTLWRVIRIGLSLGFLLVVIGVAVVTVVLPKAIGSTPLTVLTSSMEPGLPPGSLLVIRPVAIEDIRIGDVVTYQIASGEPAVITHRVIAITSSSAGGLTFTFHGDNNSAPDADAITPAQIQGRLWYSLPLLGWASTALAGPYRVWAIPAAGGLLLVYAAWLIGSGTVAAVRTRTKGRPARHSGGQGA